jgi:hypothetical protein
MFYSSGNTGVLKHGLIQEVEPKTAPHTKFSMIPIIFPHNCNVEGGIVRFLEQSLFFGSRGIFVTLRALLSREITATESSTSIAW